MQDSDLLQTIAEIAIALAGFTGVVAFLGERARGKWRSVDLFRFSNLLGTSIAALLLSFAPILLFKLGAPEAAAWRSSSGLIAVYLVIGLLRSIRGLRSLPKRERLEIPAPALSVVFVIMAAVGALLVSNAAGFAYPGESGPVLVGLVSLLGFSSFQFVRLLHMLHIKNEGDV